MKKDFSMKKSFAFLFLAIPLSYLNAAIDPYSFYLYGFQGSNITDSAMKEILAAAWDQLPESTSQQSELKAKLSAKFQDRYKEAIATVVTGLRRFAQAQQEHNKQVAALKSDNDACQTTLKDCASTTKTLDAQLNAQIKGLEDVKSIKETIETRLTNLKTAEDMCRSNEKEEASALQEYLQIINDKNGNKQLVAQKISHLKDTYQAYEQSILHLQKCCQALNMPVTIMLHANHGIIAGLLEIYQEY